LAGYLEDLGYEAVIHKRFQTLMAQSGETNPETENHRIYKNISIEPQLDFTQAAVCCGLGELGLSDTVLTDDFGPFQRFAFILTNARFESDALAEPHLCDQCGACLDGCPGRAFKSEQTVRPIAGQSWPVHAKDSWQCAAYYKGAGRKTNPFMPPDALADLPDREAILDGDKQLTPDEAKALLERLTYYPPGRHAYVASICGRACDRACYDHLEQTGKLRRRFAEPFRKAKPWSLGPAT
jgi:ferredoxin